MTILFCIVGIMALCELSYRKGKRDSLKEVLKGLHSEDDSTQVRAIIAEVSLMKDSVCRK